MGNARERCAATIACCRHGSRTIVVMTLGLFWIGCAVATVELALIPTPAFLLDLQPMRHEGMALFLWCVLFAISAFLTAIVIDGFGHKRIYAYGVIMSVFGIGLMLFAVGLHPHPTASPFFWCATALTAVVTASVVISSYAAVSALEGHGAARKAALGVAVALYSAGNALGGVLHAPMVRDAVSGTLSASVPVLEHVQTSAALTFAAFAALLALFTIPLVRKHPHLSQARSGFVGAWRPLVMRRLWRLVGFALSWLCAKASIATCFYLVPVYLERSGITPTGLDVSGLSVAIVYGTVAMLAVPMQIATTTVHPLGAIAFGAFLSAAAPWFLLWRQISYGSCAIAGSLLVLGESIWWPRFLAYSSDITPKQVHVAVHMSVVAGIEALSRGLAAVVSPLLLTRYCPSHDACQSVPLWGILAAVTTLGTIVGIGLLRFLRDKHVHRSWTNEVLLDNLDVYGRSSASAFAPGNDGDVTLETSDSFELSDKDADDAIPSPEPLRLGKR